ncbi:MAG: hypothetical protein HY685_03900 [Chloroflexi bacterium]|nr:hypothetical protein [Chloroflexota bacterium]
MNRRSVSLFPTLESYVREFQADLLKFLDRDVTFTEALNLLILGSLLAKGKEQIKGLGKELLVSVLDERTHSEAILDQIQDEALKAAAALTKNSQGK